jgi:hypothetical protein
MAGSSTGFRFGTASAKGGTAAVTARGRFVLTRCLTHPPPKPLATIGFMARQQAESLLPVIETVTNYGESL